MSAQSKNKKKPKGKRDNGYYEKKIWIPQPDGSKKRKSIYNKDKRLLDLEVNEIKSQIAKGTYILDSDSSFEQNINKWFEVHTATKEETTQESYKIYVKHAISLLGNKILQELKPMDIQEAYNNFLYGIDEHGNKSKLHSENSLKHLHAVVNMSLNFAVENSLLSSNPCAKVKKIKVEKFKPYVYNEEQFKLLLDSVKGTEVEAIVLLAGGIGLRAGEICGLKWVDIDEINKQISINQVRYRITGKTGEKPPKNDNSARVISVDNYIIKRLKKLKNDSDYVLCRSTKKPYRNDEIYHLFVDALDWNGLPKTRLHDLRHYNATMMAYYGIDVKTAAQRLGHARTSTTLEIYQHVTKKMADEAAIKLGKMFKGNVVQDVVNKEKQENSKVGQNS